MKNNLLVATLIVLSIVGTLWIFYAKIFSSPGMPVSDVNTSPQAKYIGKISTTSDGFLQYQNDEIGAEFLFGKEWHVGNNSLGYGSLILFNYDQMISNGKGFTNNQNKIDIVVTNKSYSEQTPDFPEKTKTTKQVILGKASVKQEDIELVDGQYYRVYYVPFLYESGKFLQFAIYGDLAGFNSADSIIASINWLKY